MPYCPEENGIIEQANRTLRESLGEHKLGSLSEAEPALKVIMPHYNNVHLHCAVAFKPPAIYYRGNSAELDANRALKLRQARHRRKQINLKLNLKS